VGGQYAQFFSCCTACRGCGFAFSSFVAFLLNGGGGYAQFFGCCTACSGCGFAFLFFVAFFSMGRDTTPNFLAVARHVVDAVLRFFSLYQLFQIG